jgi:predicted permease
MRDNLIVLLIGVVFFLILLLVAFLIRKHDVKTWMSDGLSIDESNVSVMVIFFIVWNFIGAYLVLIRDVFPDNVMFLVLGLAGGILGRNVGGISISKKNQNVNPTVQQQVQNTIPQQPSYHYNDDSDSSGSGK